MEIALLRTLPIGNAVEVSLNVDGGVSHVTLLRKEAVSGFAGHSDPNATIVLDEDVPIYSQVRLFPGLLDTEGLTDGRLYYYRAYGYHAARAVWLASDSQGITPEPTASLDGPDPLAVVRDRIRAAIRAEVVAGNLKPKSADIEVLTAPPQAERTAWPVVSVHVDNDQSTERGLGEFSGTDLWDSDAEVWREGEGWLSRWNLTIMGWSLNPDERISLRKAIKKAVMGNLPVFEHLGLLTPDLSLKDHEDFNTYGFPVYMVTGNFTCLAPAWLSGQTAAIADTEATGTPTEDATGIEYPDYDD